MHPHEKPGYVDACRKAGVCPSVVHRTDTGLVYCEEQHYPWEMARTHYGHSQVAVIVLGWRDGDCAPLEQGTP